MARIAPGISVILCVWAALPSAGRAQPPDLTAPPQRFRESVTLDTDSAAVKKLSTLSDYLAEKQWNLAIEMLEGLATQSGDKLVEVAPGRYLNVARYTSILLALLPPEGLAAYRRKVDPRARQWLETGKGERNPAELERIVEKSFASSVGDEALLLLGDWAWEAGQYERARGYWKQILPPARPNASADPALMLRYPDSNLDLPAVVGRLVLASAAEGSLDRAQRELQVFRKLYPNAVGTLASRNGNLAETLATVLASAETWNFSPPAVSVSTFAVDASRSAVMPREIDVGGRLWSADLSSHEDAAPGPARLEKPASRPLSRFPVVYGNVVLTNDSERIYAFDLRTGRPAWSNRDENPNPRVASARPGRETDEAAIYPPVPGIEPPRIFQPVIGVPWYTLTVDSGRLYAKMGTPVTALAVNELAALRSEIVCLDLEHGQGKILWKSTNDEFDPGWAFEGSPVAANDRVYVAMTHSEPQLQTNVASFDATSGRLLWNRKICSAVSGFGEARNVASHRLLTLAGDMLYLSTDTGAIAAVHADSGTIEWVATYESRSPGERAEPNLIPCLSYGGFIVAAPNDSDELFCIDAASGIVVWRQYLRGGVRQLLGANREILVVSGDFLWGLDLARGKVLWQVGTEDPIGHGYGRGVLAGESVYWPNREEVLIVEQNSGRIRRRVALTALQGETAGNLAIANGLLLVAQPDRLVAFGEFSKSPQKTKDAVAASQTPFRLTTRQTLDIPPTDFGYVRAAVVEHRGD